MALKHFGFIVTGDHFEQAQGTEHFKMKVVGVKEPVQAIAVAQAMVASGIQLIELCGGFSPVWAGRIIEAINYAVPVGVVAYGPESIEAMHQLFTDPLR
jgi:2-keto-3-deoxy-6-phosphogluconate aldolase